MTSGAPTEFPLPPDRFADLRAIKIDAPAWVWPGMAVSILVMVALIVLGGGGISPGSAIAMIAAFGFTGLIITAISLYSARLDFRERELLVRGGFGEDAHRVPYRDIVAARGDLSGRVTVTYRPAAADTPLAEQAEVTFRVKPRLAAPMLALRLEAEHRREREEQPGTATG